jgi:hypothetical protein
VFKKPNLVQETDLMEAFGFWLKHTLPGWGTSRPEIRYADSGEPYPVFVLYHDGVAVGEYTSPMAALERIGNTRVTSEYLFLTTHFDDSDEAVQVPLPHS